MVVNVAVSLLAKARKMTRSFTESAVEMSVVDPLTGVANLRGLRQRVVDEIERCGATGRQLILVTVDLDDFKSVNDRYSHTKGDAVLVATARAIRDQVRVDEFVARRGGDEFAAVCVFEPDGSPTNVVSRVTEAISRERRKLC